MVDSAMITPGLASLKGYRAEHYPLTSSASSEAIFVPRIPVRVRAVPSDPPSEAETPSWVTPVIERLAEIVGLPAGWDSYGARPVSREAVEMVLDALSAVMSERSPAPWIVPLPSGGIQLHWDEGPAEIEIALDLNDEDSWILIDDEEIPGGAGLWPEALMRIHALLAPT